MMPAARFVEGDLLVHPPAGVSGWCRLPEGARRRVEIEILVDSIAVASTEAAADGDGRNAFSLILPSLPDESGTSVIEARERDSHIVFGRVVLFEEAIAQPIERRLATLDVSRLKRPLAGLPAGPADRLRGYFGSLGMVLLQAAGAAVTGGDIAALARRMPRLPLSGRPEVSVIAPASPCIGTTLRWLAALQSLADTTPIEVIVADDGAEPRSALLPLLCKGLRYWRDSRGLTGGVLNVLAREARGETLCFLDDDPEIGHWHWPLPAESEVHLGGRLAGGAGAPVFARRRGMHGFALYIARAAFLRAGGFEPALRAMEAYTDMAAKCRLLGAAITAWG